MDSLTRLTALAHGGGCGCKIGPALLEEILAGLPQQITDPAMLVGLETRDDAVVYRLDDDKAVVATTDFFLPIVDDPHDFGAIAATNALSDVYAMGGRPLFALAVAGMPTATLPPAVISAVLAGGAEVCARAGIMVAGGHSIDSREPFYGLAVVGLVHPGRVKRNSAARPGDVLILGKGLGVGILSAALKQGKLSAGDYAELLATTTRLNAIGADLAALDGVHAMTDVTGFGLLGHLMEVCRGSGLAAQIRLADVPLLRAASALAKAGHVTGAGQRNALAVQAEVDFPSALADWQRNLLHDPQTSGGLLVAVAPELAGQVLALFHTQGFGSAAAIGVMTEGQPGVSVRP